MAHQSGGPAKYQALRDALDEIAPPTGKKAKGSRAAAIGYYLRKNRRVCVDGQYIDRLGETEDHSALWGVQKAQDVAG
jgi:hypothetical protein